ncbi:Rqc2 family fibronectin-binding protein [Liquorilactobacillus capillatus]|uniref:Rqc2 homolog RqcH n=1 Tax=Liquorilactobacillus capillatus DSM 19910 TaxID=1423731 RepID=A0A0R1MAD9_9LACO|nr:NFACT RNA binding domain-containing protein [Liquorilactobacillus capillatus]KRL01179.1 fibronectin-binding protein [Liquorilactobacillus capillatus DSM 19910]
MPFDGLFTHAMVHELQMLVSGRVGRISQPFPNEVVVVIRAQRHNFPLLLSAHPSYARLQVSDIPYKNPPVPTNFTMTLRKYLEGAKLISVEQLENDRVVYLGFETRNELGDRMPLLLSIEIMGRYSNVILINQTKNQIIDTIKHIGPDQNRFRTLLPGAPYNKPPKQKRLDPFDDNSKYYLNLAEQYPNREVLAAQLSQTYQGIAKEHALYLADQLHEHDKDLTRGWEKALAETINPMPSIITGKRDFFTYFVYPTTRVKKTFVTLSELLDNFYRDKATSDRVQQQGSQLIHIIKNNLQKNRKKLKKLQKELASTAKADRYRIKGELLTTYLFQIKRGMTEIELPNYYAGDEMIKITLSNQLSPSQNAQKYFKKYQKLKNAVSFLKQQINLTQAEVDYLEELQAQIELAEPQDLPDIKLELQQQGYLKAQKRKKHGKIRKEKISQPAIYFSSDGTKIAVGKNNLQNDRLTLKTAHKDYFWLHAKNIPGSHVIIYSHEPTQQTLTEAANLAAYFSKSRDSASVPVDYVQVKKIRKPNGAKPGFVIYEGQKTLFITPQRQLIDSLK